MRSPQPAPEAPGRLEEALARLRAAALAAFAARLGLSLRHEAARALEARWGLAPAAERLRRVARLPRLIRPLAFCWLLRGTRR
ncbi:MAG: hypothetical protein WHV64_17750 [Geminicoccaceae bacterium]